MLVVPAAGFEVEVLRIVEFALMGPLHDVARLRGEPALLDRQLESLSNRERRLSLIWHEGEERIGAHDVYGNELSSPQLSKERVICEVLAHFSLSEDDRVGRP